MLRFCSWLSKTLGVPITQLYPVRGHSFGQCDRNFGIVKYNTLKPYLENITTCQDKPEPFALVHDESLLLDWDQALTPYFEETPKQKGDTFRIQQYCIIKYKTCGTIAVSKNYRSLIFQPYKFMFFCPYLSEENRWFYQDIYDTQLPTVSCLPIEAENSDADFDLDEDDEMEED
ncbi:hypothetical protein PR048_020947 [Dryococelus australis]|uniref:Uncharacterized protein n=1 Tax=Dryococelus australis TaxID=614101 RepID=A0ABQ9GWV3_9NEOP|nr:hypothetical protein PR048_020947 [Dryococelus australis]